MDFNSKALHWDTDQRTLRAQKIAQEIMNHLPIEMNKHALEFGCGTGLISFFLKDQFEQITLMDTSEGMIRVLSDKIILNNITHMTGIVCDINSCSSLSPEYDVIYSSMAMHHVQDTQLTLQNLYTLLKDCGCLCIVDLTEDDGRFHQHEKDFSGHHGFNPEHMKHQMIQAGFSDVNSHIFYHDVKEIGDDQVPYHLFIITGRK